MLEDEDFVPREMPDELLDLVNSLLPTIEANRNQEIPRYTEDGVPVRKIHVSNLPAQVTRSELFRVFIPYGIIERMWIRKDEYIGRNFSSNYAFVTYSSPLEAQRALSSHNIVIRERRLKVMRADTWHQPDYANINLRPAIPQMATGNTVISDSITNLEASPSTSSGSTNVGSKISILDKLNRDCMDHVFSYIPLNDLIRSERVSKDWQALVHYHIKGKRTFSTSKWNHENMPLTTAGLRKLLKWIDGRSLESLSISQKMSFYNDRIALSICKLCPNLKDLKVLGLTSRCWSPLFFACKKLTTLEFVGCQVTDGSLFHMGSNNVKIEHLAVAFNTLVTGSFLANIRNDKIKSLILCGCQALNGVIVKDYLENCPELELLKLDGCPNNVWQWLPEILCKFPNLVELSLTNYLNYRDIQTHYSEIDYHKALTSIRNLRRLHLKNNLFVNNRLLKLISETCTNLEYLDVSICNYIPFIPESGVTDEGVRHVLKRCPLTHLDVSHVLAFNGSSLATSRAPLTSLSAHGCPMLRAAALAPVIARPTLLELDVCGCPVGAELVAVAAAAMTKRCTPIPLKIWLAGTPAAAEQELPTHELLTVDIRNSRCQPGLYPGCSTFFFDKSANGRQLIKEVRDPGPAMDIMDIVGVLGQNLSFYGFNL